jgi:hypothetical protein
MRCSVGWPKSVRLLVVPVLVGAVLVVAGSPAGAVDDVLVVPGQGSVFEGDDGTAVLEVPVRLSAPAAGTVTAQWQTLFGPGVNPGRAAEPGVDFDAGSGTLTFVPGDTEEVVQITVHGDSAAEAEEVVVVGFSNVTNAVIGGYFGLGFGTILDDDTPRFVVPGKGSVSEGNEGTTVLEVPVQLSGPASGTVTAQWQTLFGPGVNPANPAESGVDFDPASGTVTFVPGDTAEVVQITAHGDLTVEPDELVVVGFSNVNNAGIGGFFGLGFGTIVNDDTLPLIVLPRAVEPDGTPGEITTPEGDASTTVVEVPVRLSRPSTEVVTVLWNTGGVNWDDTDIVEAEAHIDYLAIWGGVVTFAPGDTEETVEVTVLGDTDVEPEEDLALVFYRPVNARLPLFNGLFGVTSVRIVDDDVAPTALE